MDVPNSLYDGRSVAFVAEACGCGDDEAIDLLTVRVLSTHVDASLTKQPI